MSTLRDLLLCVDVGNSNITLAVFEEDEIIARYRMKTKVSRSSDEFVCSLAKFLASAHIEIKEVQGVIVSSVVPKIMHSLRNGIIKLFSIDPVIISADMDYGLENLLDNPGSVGADRIADSLGAITCYGAPVLVADFGTASTYDFINEKGQLIAGAISVGIESGAQSLWSQTAQLPEIEIEKPDTIMAKSTSLEMQAGIFYQFLGGFEKTVEAYQKAYGKPFKVVLTGGLGRVIAPYSDLIDVYDPNLLFKGLLAIYRYIHKNQDRN